MRDTLVLRAQFAALCLAGCGAAGCILAGCALGEDERCPEGFAYVSGLGLCREAPDGGTPDGAADATGDGLTDALDQGDVDKESDGGSEAADGSALTVTGLGEPCATAEDCASFSADYCAIDPMSGEGMCTVVDCAPEDCGDAYQCCDCEAVGYPRVCVPDAFAETAAEFCECR